MNRQHLRLAITLIGLMALLATPAASRKRPAFPPPYLSQNAMPLTVVSVQRSDTATIIRAAVRSADSWQLSPAPCLTWGNGATRLPLRHAVVYNRSVTPHQALPYYPDSTYRRQPAANGAAATVADSIVLVFPPLPRGTDVVTLETDTAYRTTRLFGLRTDGRLFPARAIPKPQRVKARELPDWQPSQKYAVVEGRVIGYRNKANMGFSYMCTHNDFFPDTLGVKFEPDFTTGHYRYIVPITAPYVFQFGLPGQGFDLLLCPGDSVTLNLDLEAVANARATGSDPSPRYLPAGVATNAPAADLLAAYPILKQWKRDNSYIQFALLDSLADETFADYAERKWQDHLRRISEINGRRDLTPAQHDYLALSSEALYLEQRFRFEWNKDMTSKLKNDSTRLAALKQQVTLTDPHARELRLMSSSMRGAYALRHTGYNDYFRANGLMHTPMGQWLSQLAQAEALHAEINSLHPVTDPARWDSVAPQYRPDLMALNKKILAELQQMSDTALTGICPVPDCPPDSLLAALLAPHRGHAVLVDFWATWCGPCLTGMKAMEAVKDELSQAGVHFIYITDESSPYDGWKAAAARHAGAHYRIKMADIMKMHVPEFSGGYPHYLIYDSQGRLVKAFTGWADDRADTFRQLLLKGMQPQR